MGVRVCDACVRRREVRSHGDDFLEVLDGFLRAEYKTATHECACGQVAPIRVRTEIVSTTADRTFHSKLFDDPLSNAIADGEHVSEIAVEALAPEGHASGRLQELHVHLKPVS